jgi:hypothetical protein
MTAGSSKIPNADMMELFTPLIRFCCIDWLL